MGCLRQEVSGRHDGVVMKKSKLFENTKVRLVTDYQFFATLALHMEEMEMSEAEWAAAGYPDSSFVGTDGRRLYFKRSEMEKKDNAEKLSVLCHEVLHAALGHIWPWRIEWRDRKLWNIAADHVVNNFLKSEEMYVPGDWYCDDRFSGMSVEEVYQVLQEEQQEQSGGGGNEQQPGMEDLLPPPGDGSDNSSGAQQGQSGGASDDKNDGQQFPMDGSGSLEQQMREQEKQWRDRLVEAVAAGKMQGHVPAGMEELVEELTEPKLPLEKLAAMFLDEVSKSDYSMLEFDRRYVSRRLYLPSLDIETTRVAVGLDSSGSIDLDMAADFLSMMLRLVRARDISEVRLLMCDAAVVDDVLISDVDDIPRTLKGRGGTSFVPVFEKLAEDRYRPSCLFYMTDLMGTFPDEEPDYPVIWVVPEEYAEYPVPFGTVVSFG